MYEKLTAKENLQFFSSLYEKKPRSIDRLLKTAGLERDADKRVADYSKGNDQIVRAVQGTYFTIYNKRYPVAKLGCILHIMCRQKNGLPFCLFL